MLCKFPCTVNKQRIMQRNVSFEYSTIIVMKPKVKIMLEFFFWPFGPLVTDILVLIFADVIILDSYIHSSS